MFPLIFLTTAAAGTALSDGANGSYMVSDSDAVLRSRARTALTDTLEPMNFAMRMLAEGRLEGLLGWCSDYTFSIDEAHMSVQCDGRSPVSGSLSGTTSSHTSDQGKTVSVTVQPAEDRAVFTFVGNNGFQVTTYRFTDNGLQVTKEIHNENLEVPLRLEINYARTGG